LANSLIAYRVATLRPEVELIVLEREQNLGGNHLWSFHDGDLTPEQQEWVKPLVERSWPHHEVRFPTLRRRLERPYHTLTSERLHRIVSEALGQQISTGVDVRDVASHRIDLADGRTIEADAVIDGRGDPGGTAFAVAYQKFVGRLLELKEGHGLEGPILMDATVDQIDGFRFVYTLPFTSRSLFVEDTRYSDTAALDREEFRTEIDRYAANQGWQVESIGREEVGVLPIVLAGDIEAFWRADPADVPRSGMRAALFHPTTGYSLPEAVRLADDLARLPRLRSEELFPWIRERSRRLWRRGGYFRLLNRMLFRAAEPHQRYVVMQRFYNLPEALIHRFYAGQLTLGDRIRILVGKPPVPIRRALKCLR
jgi:lycopene beta-cyclase